MPEYHTRFSLIWKSKHMTAFSSLTCMSATTEPAFENCIHLLTAQLPPAFQHKKNSILEVKELYH